MALRLGALQVLAWGTLYYTPILLIEAADRSGARAQGWTFAWSAGLVLAALLAPACGRVVDAGRGPLLMVCGSAAAAVLFGAWARAGSPWVVGAALVGLGLVTAATLYEPLFAMLLQGGRGQRAVTQVALVGGLASTALVPTTARALDVVGWRGTLAAFAALHALAALLYAAWLPRGSGPARPVGSASSVGPPPALVVAFALHAVVAGVIGAYGVPLLASGALSRDLAVAAVAMIGLAQVGGRVIGLAPAWRSAGAWVGAPVAAGAALAVVALWPGRDHAVAAVTFAIGWGACHGLMTLARPVLVAAASAPGDYGVAAGRVHRAAALGRAAAPFVASVVIERHGVTALLGLLVGVSAVVPLLLAPPSLGSTLWSRYR